MNDERQIAWARMRQAEDADDALDRWRIAAAERQAQREIVTKDAKLDTTFVHDDDAESAIYRDVADAIDMLGNCFRKQIKDLRVEVAELRGQMCALRGSEAVLLAKLFGDAVEPALREYIDKRMSNGRQRHD
jgi:hypothetical protein